MQEENPEMCRTGDEKAGLLEGTEEHFDETKKKAFYKQDASSEERIDSLFTEQLDTNKNEDDCREIREELSILDLIIVEHINQLKQIAENVGRIVTLDYFSTSPEARQQSNMESFHSASNEALYSKFTNLKEHISTLGHAL